MGALFGVVHDTIVDAKSSFDKRQEVFGKSWGISDVAHQANAPRYKNFQSVRNNAIALLNAHAEEILNARRLLSTPTAPIEPSPHTHSVAHDEMEVDDSSGPTNPADSASREKPSDLEDPAGKLELMQSRVAVFNERFRDHQMGIRTLSDPHPQFRSSSEP